MNRFVLPILIFSLLVYGTIKKVNLYDSFVDGAKQAVKLCVNLLPFIAAIFLCLQLMRISGFDAVLTKIFAPVFSLMGIPPELANLVILSPLSGSGSLALLNDIYLEHGVDSYISRCASIIAGSTETVFYLSAVYFSGTKIKKLGLAIPIALFATLCGCILGCLICKIM